MFPKHPVVQIFGIIAVCLTVIFCTLAISGDVAKMAGYGPKVQMKNPKCKCEYCDGDKCFICPCGKE